MPSDLDRSPEINTEVEPDQLKPLTGSYEFSKFIPIKTLNALQSSRSIIWSGCALALILLLVSAPLVSQRTDKLLLLMIGTLLGVTLTARRVAMLIKRARSLLYNDDSETGKITGYALLDKLITDQHEHQADLIETIDSLGVESDLLVERYEVLTENLAAAIVIRDPSSKILYCSPYTEVLTGYALSEIYAHPSDFFATIIHPKDAEKYARALKVSAYGEAFQVRYRIYHKSQIEMWVETRTVPILAESGEVTSSLSITLDITRTVRYQQRIEEKNKDLEDFTYMVSHDLKGPLFTVKGMTQVLAEDFQPKLGSEFAAVIDHIKTATNRLEQLITSVLEYSRISSQEDRDEAVKLAEVIDDVAREHATTIKETTTSLEILPGLPVVLADRIRLYQVFGNLIENAIKYRAPGRPLLVQIRNLSAEDAREAVISIKDNGLGIPADRVDDIFRPFQRAHGHIGEGSGIGLACVKKIVEKLGGDVTVRTEEGVGSEFLVTLPKMP